MMTTNLPELLRQWNDSHGSEFQVRESDANWNLEKQSLTRYELTDIAGTACLLAQASKAGTDAGIPSQNLHLSLWGKIENPSAFIERFLEIAQQRNSKKVFFGADEFHFLPGIPKQDQPLIKELEKYEFQSAQVADFCGSLKTPPIDAYIDQALAISVQNKLELREFKNLTEEEELHSFLCREFPGRWVREFEFWRSREDTRRSWWLNFYQNKNELVGFARLSHRGRSEKTQDWTPGALKMPLTKKIFWEASDGSLGPIGVSKSLQGKGFGKALLGLVLQALRQNSVNQICIDWTNAFKYYEPLEFERRRSYVSSWRNLQK